MPRQNPETALMHAIQDAAQRAGATLFRNNVGCVQSMHGSYIRYGVCNPGGADLIGWTRTGRFLAVEVKRPAKNATPEQAAFLAAVNRAGGLGIVAHSPAEVLAALGALA